VQGGHKPGKPGILGFFWRWKTQGILREFCATSGKNCNKQSIFSLSFKCLCKAAVDWVNRMIRNRDEVRVHWWPVILLELMWNDPLWRSLLHLLFVVITYGKVSLWLWKILENSGIFFLLLCGNPVVCYPKFDWVISALDPYKNLVHMFHVFSLCCMLWSERKNLMCAQKLATSQLSLLTEQDRKLTSKWAKKWSQWACKTL